MKILLVITSLDVGAPSEIRGGDSCYWLKGNRLGALVGDNASLSDERKAAVMANLFLPHSGSCQGI